MSASQPSALLRHIRLLAGVSAADPHSDRELLHRFTAGHDEAAFAVLVRRHSPMVLSVCRRILHRTEDVEDAFQATFLVLLRKAAGHAWRESLGGWLHGVAVRVALRMRAETARRAAAIQPKEESVGGDPLEQLSARELLAAFDEELARLPATYREPLVLCYLQGRTQEEAARQLNGSLSTLRRRLERGRKLLHMRMARRGLALPAALLAALPSRQTATAALAVSAALDAYSARAIALADGVMRAAVRTSLQATAAVLLMLGVLAAGAGLATRHMLTTEPSQAAATDQPEVPKTVKGERTDLYGDPLPSGALARLGTVRFRHRDFIGSVAISPDGKVLAAGGYGGIILLYDTATGRKLRHFEALAGGFPALAFSPDGKTLASAGPNRVQIWDPITGKQLHRINSNASREFSYGFSMIVPLVFSRDGKWLACVKPGYSISICDVEKGKIATELTGHQHPIHCLAFSPDGKTLFSADEWHSDGCTVRAWAIGTGKEVRKFSLTRPGPVNQPHPLCFSPDGKTLAFTAFETMRRKRGKVIENYVGEMVSFLDLATGATVRKLELAQNYKVAAFSPDGKTIATMGSVRPTVGTMTAAEGVNHIQLWDAATGQRLFPLPPFAERFGFVTSGSNLMAFAPDGKKLAVASGASALHVWDLVPGREAIDPVEAHHDIIQCVTFSPDGRTVATASSDHTIALWDAATGRQRLRLRGQEGVIESLTFSPDGKRLASASGFLDQTVRLWDAATGKQLHRYQVPLARISADGESVPVTTWVGFAAKGTMLAAGGTDRRLRLLDVATGKEVRNQMVPGLRTAPNATPRELFQFPGGIRDVTFTPDGRTMALCAGNKIVSIVDVDSGRPLFQYETEVAASVIALSPDGKTLFHGGKSNRLMETARGASLHKMNMPDEVFAAAFAPDGRILAVSAGPLHGTIYLFDVPTGKELLRLQGHESRVRTLAFSPDGTKLASGQWDSTALIWDVSAARRKLPVKNLAPRELDRFWTDLRDADAAKAHAALWTLAAVPDKAVSLLKDRLRSVPRVSAERLRRLIADLDADDFAKREEASRQLAKLGTEAEPALRQALENKPSLELRRRAEALLGSLTCQTEVTPDALRQLRAIQVLEQIGSPEARRILAALAQGAPAAPATRDAIAALARLARRSAAP